MSSVEELARQIGNAPAFPASSPAAPGMSYRQWLIGVALQGAAMYRGPGEVVFAVEGAIAGADRVCVALAQERLAGRG
jgi:hypothetical protein